MTADVQTPARKRSWFARLTSRTDGRERLLPLYRAVVALGRDPAWYRDGSVPDTVDGRFDMIAALTALVLIRMEQLPEPEAKPESVLFTELFIDDMDESLRQIGIGDYVVGKYVGRMVGALGGRLEALRESANSGDFLPAVRRNIFHEAPPREEAVAFVADRLARIHRGLQALSLDDLRAARLPQP